MRSWVFAAVLCSTAIARAGQLHIEELGLKESRAENATIVLGTVAAARGKDRAKQIDVIIERVWSSPQSSPPAVGAKQTFELNPGVEWTNPHKSPIDRRLRGGQREAAVGARVVLVPVSGRVEVLPATDEVVHRIEILWAADPATRIAQESDVFLRASLGELDLAALAAAELQKRGKLDTKTLLLGDRAFTDKYFHGMKPADQERVIREGVELAKKDPALRDRLCDVAFYDPVRALVPKLAPIAALYAFDKKENERRLQDIRLQLVVLAQIDAPLELDPYVDFLEQMMRFRPTYRSSDDDFPKLTARLSPPKKTRLAVLLIANAHKATGVAKDDKYDSVMLWEGVRLAKEAPGPELIATIAALDPSLPRVTSTKQGVMDAIISVGTAVAGAKATEKQRVRDVVEPWLEKDMPVDEKVLDEYRTIVGEAKRAPPVEATIELRAGQKRRFPSGMHIECSKGEGGALEIELGIGKEPSTSWFLEPKDDWYREWWLPPYLVFASRAGTDRVKLHLVPHTTEPVAASSADLFEQAEKIAKRRGCTEDGNQDYQEEQGRFVYSSKDKRGTQCTILIGGRTRKVVRMTP